MNAFSRTPASLFVSPFGLSGVPVGGSSAPVVPWEAAVDDVDESSFGCTMLSTSPGAVEARVGDVTTRSMQNNLALQSSDESQQSKPDPIYEKELRRAEAHLPGGVSYETTCRFETISIGEKMTKAAKKLPILQGGMESIGAAPPKAVDGKNGKSGWGVISRNFAVSSALSSLNRDLKTFGTRPHEAAIDRERAETARIPRFMVMPGTVFHRRYSWINVCSSKLTVYISRRSYVLINTVSLMIRSCS